MRTVAVDGWHRTRLAIFTRDGGCVAVQWRIFGGDAATDQCRNKAGWAIPWDDIFQMEFDHVREQLGGERPDDEAHGVTVCPWHHRGDRWRSDSKDHRATLRDWLRKHYPEVWNAAARS